MQNFTPWVLILTINFVNSKDKVKTHLRDRQISGVDCPEIQKKMLHNQWLDQFVSSWMTSLEPPPNSLLFLLKRITTAHPVVNTNGIWIQLPRCQKARQSRWIAASCALTIVSVSRTASREIICQPYVDTLSANPIQSGSVYNCGIWMFFSTSIHCWYWKLWMEHFKELSRYDPAKYTSQSN